MKEELQKQLQELQMQLQEVEKEEIEKHTKPIKEIIDKEIGDEYVCGVLITKQMLFQLIDNMIVNNKPIFLNYEIFKK